MGMSEGKRAFPGLWADRKMDFPALSGLLPTRQAVTLLSYTFRNSRRRYIHQRISQSSRSTMTP